MSLFCLLFFWNSKGYKIINKYLIVLVSCVIIDIHILITNEFVTFWRLLHRPEEDDFWGKEFSNAKKCSLSFLREFLGAVFFNFFQRIRNLKSRLFRRSPQHFRVSKGGADNLVRYEICWWLGAILNIQTIVRRDQYWWGFYLNWCELWGSCCYISVWTNWRDQSFIEESVWKQHWNIPRWYWNDALSIISWRT